MTKDTNVPGQTMTTVRTKKGAAEARTNIEKCLAATKAQLAAFEGVINPVLAVQNGAVDSSIGTPEGNAYQDLYDSFNQLNNAMMHRITPGN